MQKISYYIIFSISFLITTVVNAQHLGETVWIPMTQKVIFGNKDIKLEATLYKPEGEGPFPVVIFNHGSTGPGVIPRTMTINPWGFGEYLNNKKIALLIPMRRGRGKSDGSYKEGYKCSAKSVKNGIVYATESLNATFKYLKTKKWADKEKIVLAGNSRGGLLSVIYAAENSNAVKGVINFSGGWMNDDCKDKTGVDVNTVLFEKAGKKSKVPNLFLYGRNDNYYSDASIENYAKVFKDAGGSVELDLFTVNYGANGHMLFYDFWNMWLSRTDSFLERLDMVTK